MRGRLANACCSSFGSSTPGGAQAKAALRKGDAGTLNIYTTEGGGFLRVVARNAGDAQGRITVIYYAAGTRRGRLSRRKL